MDISRCVLGMNGIYLNVIKEQDITWSVAMCFGV